MTVKNIFQVHAREEPDSRASSDSDSHPDNPFADPAVAERYAIIYERAQYECRHVFDPELTWTPEEEKALVRKLDWHVCLWAVWHTHPVSFVYLYTNTNNSVLCSSASKSIEEISSRPFRITCWTTSIFPQTVIDAFH